MTSVLPGGSTEQLKNEVVIEAGRRNDGVRVTSPREYDSLARWCGNTTRSWSKLKSGIRLYCVIALRRELTIS
jgi:hypothetical protein